MYPVYGFGARVKQENNTQPTAVQHCFPVSDGEVHGVMGVLEAYEVIDVISLCRCEFAMVVGVVLGREVHGVMGVLEAYEVIDVISLCRC
jgi:hypothetical protein